MSAAPPGKGSAAMMLVTATVVFLGSFALVGVCAYHILGWAPPHHLPASATELLRSRD
jgi:hypothetical protein